MITFGDPRVFAIQLLPLKGAPLEPDPSAAATWVSLELLVTGKNLTAHTHEDSGTFHRGVHWPAIYLARWLVRSWHSLFEAARWPIPTLERNARDVAQALDRRIVNAADDDGDDDIDMRDRFIEQHALQSAAAGALLPGVYLTRDGNRVSVAWDSPPLGEVSFHRQRGESDIPVGAFLHAIRRFIEWVADALTDAAAQRDRQELNAWLERLDSPEQALAVLLGYTGLDHARWREVEPNPSVTPESFFALDHGWVQRGALADPTVSSIAVAFRCSSPRLAPHELRAVRDLVCSAQEHPEAMRALEALADQIPDLVGNMRDYDQGYELARQVRALLGNEDQRLDIDELLDNLEVPVEEIELSDADLDGGAICDEAHGPMVFLNPRSPKATSVWGRRMVLAHELCHLLFDRGHAVPLAVISGPWAPPPIERRANAFAAELLLPRAALHGLGIFSPDVTEEQLQALMSAYQVGVTTCTWHLHNRLGKGDE